MEFKNIEDLIKLVSESSLTTFEMEQEGTKLILKKEAQAVVSAPVAQVVPQVQFVPEVSAVPAAAVQNGDVQMEAVKETVTDGQFITSPMVGTFYASSAPDKPPYVKVGDKVKKGQVVCIVEAMKLMNEIESTVDGEIVEILVNNEDMVEFGQKMFVVK
ncbi:MAG: acetyl-CoA carboxylase biotin carboxyl carrier protein [Lachnospiraceae bacterium]|nr:acetyl-CoA carboxylase biotin carboxyl carrier protein [Lachnospiraceae bacterium]